MQFSTVKLFTCLIIPIFFIVSCSNKEQASYTPISHNFTAETINFTNDSLVEKFNIENLKNISTDSLNKDLIQYGYDVLTNTSKYVGPNAKDPNKRYAGNNLACVNCHLAGGTKAYGGSWIGVMDRYPKFRGKNGKVNDIFMRISGCFHRSMNGVAPPNDSKEMKAIVEYYKWISSDSTLNKMPQYKGYLSINPPDREADTIKGKNLFMNYCYVCHGTNGKGVLYDDNDLSQGYIYPQLWGEDTYNIGAGMAKIETFAGFIKGNMPYGAEFDLPQLTDEDAYNIAGYVNMQYRPTPPGLENDFPNKTKKGADVPYGPYVDPFPRIQHRIGPLQPIKEYYNQLKKENSAKEVSSKK